MKKILYFASVEWGWIKQRPQFLAEELSSYYDITYTTRTTFTRTKRQGGKINCWHLFRLPFDSNALINKVNKWLIRLQIRTTIKKFDIVWLTSPSQYEYFDKISDLPMLIYDCMDDMVEFHASEEKRKVIMANEKKLVNNADILFCSSHYLANKLKNRYGREDVIIINNAIKSSLPVLPFENQDKICKRDKYTISYFGTISEWMDWDLIRVVLDKFENVEFRMYGPCAVKTPEMERLVFEGLVSHDEVFVKMSESNCLIMPFVVTELIKSVNPVKLYEYVYSGKPCLAPRYGETEPFSEYVYLYSDIDECIHAIKSLILENKGKASRKECIVFAQANTWKSRANLIYSVIENVKK